MTDLIHLVESVGRASLASFWVPLLAWTGLWALLRLVLRSSRRSDPSLRHRSAQVLLLVLPVGLVVAASVPPSWILTTPAAIAWLAPSLTQTIEPGTLPVLPQAFPGISFGLILGIGVLIVAAVGAASMLRLAHHAYAARQLLQTLLGTEVASDGLASDVSAAAQAMRVRRVPRVVVTSAEIVPMTLGAWRPVVVVPVSLDERDRRLALTHEFAHVVRRDPLAQVAEAIAAAVLAAHPAVCHLARECSLLRELACDATVLDSPGVARPAYAALLHRYAVAGARPPAYAVGIADGSVHVHHRLTAMTHTTHRYSRATRAGLVALLAVVAGLAMTAGTALAQSPGAIRGTATIGTAAPVPQPTAAHAGRPLVTLVQLADTHADAALVAALREDPAYVEHRAEADGELTVWFVFADVAESRAWLSGSPTLARLDAASGK